MNKLKMNSPWVLLDINNNVYGISCNVVLSLSQIPTVTPLPAAPPEVRGVIDFRSHSIELIDSRILLNLKPIADGVKDFFNLMEARYQDHLNWLETLKKCVLENTEFTLEVDPHQCAFGKWYDNYKSKNANIMFSTTFAKFDTPHKAIHQIAIEAKKLIENGQKEKAMELINSVKETELKQMLHLFEEIKIAYKESRKEIVVVVGNESNCIAVSVDQIVAIENLTDIDENLIKESITDTEYLEGLGKRKDDSVVFLLNDEHILKKYKKSLCKK